MRLKMRITIAMLAMASSASAQTRKPDIGVDIAPIVTIGAGTIVTVSYDLLFRSTTGDSVASFMIRSFVPVRQVRAPASVVDDMLLADREGAQIGPRWAWIDVLPQNGQVRTGLSYDASGLPGIVHYRVRRYLAPREADPGEIDDNPRLSSFDTPDLNEAIGFTVGVVPEPADVSSAALVARLRGLLVQSCGELHWISPAGVCNSLDVKLEHAGTAFAQGAVPTGKDELKAFLNELDAQRDKHLSTAAYGLLRGNAERLLAGR